jgi:hypothetical protein
MDINPMLEPRILVPSMIDPMLVPLILDYIFNSFSLKFGRREIYDGNLHSEIHKEFITTLLNQHSVYDDKSDSLIEITELESGNETNDDNYNYNYDEVETLAFHLSLQLNLLEKRGYTMLYLQPSHIVKIRSQSRCRSRYMYLLVDLTQLVPLSNIDSNNLVLNYPEIYPFPKGVCAPELYTIGVLPFITHRSASYYSLGLLCLYLLQHQNQNLSLNHLRDTPLFYFLERCLKEEPIERRCIFI